MATYSIVIPAYNEEELLPATLASIHAAMATMAQANATLAAHRGEIVVANNASTDRTAEVAEAAGARVVLETHRQIGRARNAGAAATTSEWLIFIDADTTITADLLAATLTALASGRVVGGGAIARLDRPVGPLAKVFLHTWEALSRGLHWACGAYVFCRRDAFYAIGGFDVRYYASEEIHLSHALKKWGRRRGMKLVILKLPIITSSRKLQWFGHGHLLRMTLGFVTRPWRMRSREACAFWYERPPGSAATPAVSPPTPTPNLAPAPSVAASSSAATATISTTANPGTPAP